MLIVRVEIPESCGSGLADLMGPQVRDFRRVYLTASRQSPPKTTVSHPSSHCDLRMVQINFAASTGLHF